MGKNILHFIESSKSIDAFFNALNDYFKSLMTGDPGQYDGDVQEGLAVWNEESCGISCSNCPFSNSQEWIEQCNISGVVDLCSMIDKVFEGNPNTSKSFRQHIAKEA